MPTISVLPLGSQSAQPFQPLAMRAEAWQAIPSVSTWVMTTLRRMAQSSALYFLPSRSATAGTQASQGTTAQADSNSPPLKEPNVGVWIFPAAETSPVANPLEMGPPLSSERHDMASTAQVMGPACVAARREPFVLPERVLNTMAQARAPSTRRLYALKWSIFSAWCSPPMCQWFFHFCRGSWINSVPHPPSKFMRQPQGLSMPLILTNWWAKIVR